MRSGKIVSGVSDCIVKDYMEQIKVENFYLNQKMLFFYGNCACPSGDQPSAYYEQYAVSAAARKHEFRFWGRWGSGFRFSDHASGPKKGCGMGIFQYCDGRTFICRYKKCYTIL